MKSGTNDCQLLYACELSFVCGSDEELQKLSKRTGLLKWNDFASFHVQKRLFFINTFVNVSTCSWLSMSNLIWWIWVIKKDHGRFLLFCEKLWESQYSQQLSYLWFLNIYRTVIRENYKKKIMYFISKNFQIDKEMLKLTNFSLLFEERTKFQLSERHF